MTNRVIPTKGDPMTNRIETREQYLALFTTTAEAIEFETHVLSAGREFLPAQAILVLEGEGAEPGADYWTFLANQLEATEPE